MHPWIGLSDEVRLGLLTEWVTPELVDEVLAECGKRDARPRPLSSRFMVYYVLAVRNEVLRVRAGVKGPRRWAVAAA
jgi:hypothetical protein